MDECRFLRAKLNKAIQKKIRRRKLRPSDAIGTLSLKKFDNVFFCVKKECDEPNDFEKKVLGMNKESKEKIISIDDL